MAHFYTRLVANDVTHAVFHILARRHASLEKWRVTLVSHQDLALCCTVILRLGRSSLYFTDNFLLVLRSFHLDLDCVFDVTEGLSWRENKNIIRSLM